MLGSHQEGAIPIPTRSMGPWLQNRNCEKHTHQGPDLVDREAIREGEVSTAIPRRWRGLSPGGVKMG